MEEEVERTAVERKRNWRNGREERKINEKKGDKRKTWRGKR